MAETLLASLVGRFQSTQTVASALKAASAATLLLNPRYAGAIAASLSAGSAAAAGSAGGTAPWLLDPSELGSYQTGGAGLALQKFAVAAYQASQKA